MRTLSAVLVVMCLLQSCMSDKRNVRSFLTMENRVLMDSTLLSKHRLAPYDSNNLQGYYPIYYLGAISDTIRLGRRAVNSRCYGQKDYDDSVFGRVNNASMKLLVDTTITLLHTLRFNTYRENLPDTASIKSYTAYPFYVYNLSDSCLWVSELNIMLFTTRQAKNESGIWVDIEEKFSPFCGTGARDVVLEPNYMIVGKLLRYEGSFRTECRLRYKRYGEIVYSNAFIDYVDKRQLTLKP